MKATKRKLTLILPADVVRNAKVHAAKRNISLNAWIGDAVERALRFDGYIAAGKKILQASKKGLYKLPRKPWKREDLYDV